MSGILWVIIVGFVAGIIARLAFAGPEQTRADFILTTVLGIAGAFSRDLHRPGPSVTTARIRAPAFIQPRRSGALVVLFIWNRLVASRVISDPGQTGKSTLVARMEPTGRRFLNASRNQMARRPSIPNQLSPVMLLDLRAWRGRQNQFQRTSSAVEARFERHFRNPRHSADLGPRPSAPRPLGEPTGVSI